MVNRWGKPWPVHITQHMPNGINSGRVLFQQKYCQWPVLSYLPNIYLQKLLLSRKKYFCKLAVLAKTFLVLNLFRSQHNYTVPMRQNSSQLQILLEYTHSLSSENFFSTQLFSLDSSPSPLTFRKKNSHNLLNFNKHVHHHYNRCYRCKAGAQSLLKMFKSYLAFLAHASKISRHFRQSQTKTLKQFGKIILLPFVFPLPFAMLLQPRNFAITSQHCRGKGTCIGVSGIFGEDFSILMF